MYRKQTIRSVFFAAAAMTVASFSPQSLEAQAFSALTQYGVKVVAVFMAGANTTYGLSQALSFSARQAIIATNFTYTQNTALQIVLEDMNGIKITAPYSVTFRTPVISAAPPPCPPRWQAIPLWRRRLAAMCSARAAPEVTLNSAATWLPLETPRLSRRRRLCRLI
jgi:hypothetical protein